MTTYVSSVKDAGATVTWGSLNWVANLPWADSAVFQTRSSEDGVTWAEWSGDMAVSGSPIASPAGRYLQYSVTLNTTSSQASPSVEEVSYSGHATPTPTATLEPPETWTPTETPTATTAATDTPYRNAD